MYKVMIVDDMDIVRRELKRLKLWGEKTGFIIYEEAKNGQEALTKIEKEPVDLVITDIKMPKVDGIELLRIIVEKNLCSCVVLLSDFNEFSYARQGIILGAFDYMTKPVNEEELFGLLLRAGESITNKRKEKDRVRRLEETLEEKIEVFFPAADITELIDLIHNRDIRVMETAARMVDRVRASLNYDDIKLEAVLRNGLSEIFKGIFEKENWVKKFVDTKELINSDFAHNSGFDPIKTNFLGAIERIISIINTLQSGTIDGGIVRQVCSCVLENIDSELSLKVIADRLYMNKTYISEAFKQKTGMPFIEYLTMVKMERAKALISRENLKTYEIAEKLGFRDVEYFSKVFKKHIGMSPTEFRQKVNNLL